MASSSAPKGRQLPTGVLKVESLEEDCARTASRPHVAAFAPQSSGLAPPRATATTGEPVSFARTGLLTGSSPLPGARIVASRKGFSGSALKRSYTVAPKTAAEDVGS